MLAEKQEKQLEIVPLSNNIVSNRICDMSNNMEKQLVSRLQLSLYIAFQTDKLTDVAGMAHL